MINTIIYEGFALDSLRLKQGIVANLINAVEHASIIMPGSKVTFCFSYIEAQTEIRKTEDIMSDFEEWLKIEISILSKIELTITSRD